MIQFLLPAALLAAAGLIVPVLIHLWRPPARTIRLGSLRFLNSVPGRRLRDLRWRDRLLLLLRSALMLALAALLAQPLWVHRTTGPQRWALLSPNAKLDGTSQETWRKLLAEGYEPRWFAPGFPDVSASPPRIESVDAWSLLRDADARIPAGSKVALFASPEVSSLRGERPALANAEVDWIGSVGNDRVRSADWLAALSMSRDGHDLNATVGVSDETSIRFSRLRVPGNAMDNSNSDPSAHAALDAKKSGDSYVARLPAETPESWVRASVRRPIRVAIVHAAPRSEDARYLAAAVRAVGDVADREISVAVREESDSQVLPEADWVFRLGVARLPAALSHALADDNVNVVSDAPGDAVEQNRPTWIVASDDAAGVGGTRLWKRAVAGNDAGVMVWSDGYGEPLLTFTREGRAERWRFFSRFHPEWNDLVRRGLFPEWIRSLLLRDGDASMLRARDRRTADPTQLQPASRPAGIDGAFLPPPAERRTDLHSWIWTLAAALLAAERALSLRARPSRPVEAISAKSAESKSAEALR